MTYSHTVEPTDFLLTDRLAELTRQHWEEAGPDHESLSFDPDWGEVRTAEEQNRMRWFCLRKAGSLVGYAGVWMTKSTLNKGIIVAVIKDLFIEKTARGFGVFVGFMRFIIETLKKIGMSKIMVYEPKKYNKAGLLYKRLGFHEIETVWAMNT